MNHDPTIHTVASQVGYTAHRTTYGQGKTERDAIDDMLRKERDGALAAQREMQRQQEEEDQP